MKCQSSSDMNSWQNEQLEALHIDVIVDQALKSKMSENDQIFVATRNYFRDELEELVIVHGNELIAVNGAVND